MTSQRTLVRSPKTSCFVRNVGFRALTPALAHGKLIVLLVVAGITLLLAIPAVRLISEAHDYGEAEPLQPVVWF